ncbi:hypothetical protein A2U01_0049465, partial [Trifolium medium]|nr:hypothetical protein [Trifolium medium]
MRGGARIWNSLDEEGFAIYSWGVCHEERFMHEEMFVQCLRVCSLAWNHEEDAWSVGWDLKRQTNRLICHMSQLVKRRHNGLR